MKINFKPTFLKEYNEKQGNWNSVQEKNEWEGLKDQFDKALDVRDSVLTVASKLQKFDNKSGIDTNSDKGKVSLNKFKEDRTHEPGGAGNIYLKQSETSGSMEFSTESGNINPGQGNQVKPNYNGLSKLDVSEDIDTIAIFADGTENTDTVNNYQFSIGNSKNNRTEVFKKNSFTDNVFFDDYAEDIIETQTTSNQEVKFNPDGSITYISNSNISEE